MHKGEKRTTLSKKVLQPRPRSIPPPRLPCGEVVTITRWLLPTGDVDEAEGHQSSLRPRSSVGGHGRHPQGVAAGSEGGVAKRIWPRDTAQRETAGSACPSNRTSGVDGWGRAMRAKWEGHGEAIGQREAAVSMRRSDPTSIMVGRGCAVGGKAEERGEVAGGQASTRPCRSVSAHVATGRERPQGRGSVRGESWWEKVVAMARWIRQWERVGQPGETAGATRRPV